MLALVAFVVVLAQLPPPSQLPPLPPPPPVPCIPLVDPNCHTPPPPPPGDEPPVFAALVIAERGRLTILVTWKPAIDDHGIHLYLVFRDGRFLDAKPPDARRHRFRLLCGRHAYRVDAVDRYGQAATQRVHVRRRC